MEDSLSSFHATKKSFSKILPSFFCQVCLHLPEETVFTVSSCLHLICGKCKTTDNFCPVKDCGEIGTFSEDVLRKSCISDITKMGEKLFGEDFIKMKQRSGPAVESEKKRPEPKALKTKRENLASLPKKSSSENLKDFCPKNNPVSKTSKKISSQLSPNTKQDSSLLSKLPPNMKNQSSKEEMFKMPKQALRLDKKNVRGETLLHVAALKGDLSKVEEYLAKGADPNNRDHNGWTPLHEAVQSQNFNLAKLLLETGANPNILGGEESLSPLHEAVQLSSVPLVQLLIRKGASTNIKSSSGQVPADYCIDPEVRKALSETPCDVTDTEVFDSTIIGSTMVNNSIVITPSNDLSPSQIEDLQSLIKVMRSSARAEYSQAFTDKTTHVVFPGNVSKFATDNVLYYEALVSGRIIVTWDWIESCAEAGSWIDEEPYLVVGTETFPTNAPEKSLLNELKQLPRLLKGFNIYIRGKMKNPYPQNSSLERILKLGGANVLKREPNPESIPPNESTIPFHAKADSSLSKCSHLIIFHEDTKDVFCKYNMEHIKALPAKWLFKVLNSFEILETDL